MNMFTGSDTIPWITVSPGLAVLKVKATKITNFTTSYLYEDHHTKTSAPPYNDDHQMQILQNTQQREFNFVSRKENLRKKEKL